METFEYTGDAERVIPHTTAGPLIIAHGDRVTLADGVGSFVAREDFTPVPGDTVS